MYILFYLVIILNGLKVDCIKSSEDILPEPILYPQSLTFCFEEDSILALLKKKYPINDVAFHCFIKHNFNKYLSFLLCQWLYRSPESIDKKYTSTGLPFEILVKIFNYSDIVRDFYFFIDKKSGQQLKETYIDFPGVCVVKPISGRTFVFELAYTKQRPKKDLAYLTRCVINSLIRHSMIPSGLSFASVPKESDSDTYTVHFYINENMRFCSTMMSFFPLLLNYYGEVASHKYPVDDYDKRFVRRSECKASDGTIVTLLMDETISNADYYDQGFHNPKYPRASNQKILVFDKDENLIKNIRLRVLREQDTMYTLQAPFSLVRYELFSYWAEKKVVILYDSKTGRYPCLSLEGFGKMDLSNDNVFAHDDKRIYYNTEVPRGRLFDYHRERFLKKDVDFSPNQ